MKLGFTGTRTGMTDAQKASFARLLQLRLPSEFHHGDCIGADQDAHDMVSQYMTGCRRIIRPGPPSSYSANCKGDVHYPPKDYHARNRDIVDATDGLVACPEAKPLPVRGGTVSTINYAAKAGKPCFIIWPNGTTEARP